MSSSSFLTPSILLVNLPPQTFCGIDLLSFNSSPNFYGIKNIPLGLHFLFTGIDASLSIRHGRWIRLSSPREVLVFRWDAIDECLKPVQNEEDSMRLKANLGSIWTSRLLNYSEVTADENGKNGDWKTSISYISDWTLQRILGEENATSKWTLTSVSAGQQDIESIPGLTAVESRMTEKDLGFVYIDIKHTWPPDALGRERTEAARDFSWYLSSLIDQLSSSEDKQRGATDILGELQFTFLMVLTLSNYSCLEQWKRLLEVFTGCQNALTRAEEYFISFVRLLKVQLMLCDGVDGGLFDMREDGAPLLKKLLTRLRKSADEVTSHESKLNRELANLEKFLEERYEWNLNASVVKRGLLELEDGEQVEMELTEAEADDETGEYAPVVVDLDQGIT